MSNSYTTGLTAEQLIRHIAFDYYELSHDKVRNQRDHFMKICRDWLVEHVVSTSLNMLSEAKEKETLVDFFNLVADEQLQCAPEVAIEAVAHLQDINCDPSLRAAAGRALGIASRETARKILPEMIENETNKFVKAILVGVLRATEINNDF